MMEEGRLEDWEIGRSTYRQQQRGRFLDGAKAAQRGNEEDDQPCHDQHNGRCQHASLDEMTEFIDIGQNNCASNQYAQARELQASTIINQARQSIAALNRRKLP